MSLRALHGRPPNMNEKESRIETGEALGDRELVDTGVEVSEMIGDWEATVPREMNRKHTSW
jgi:hypothetical protein